MSNTVIIGYGFVGKATEYLLQLNGHTESLIYDPALGKLGVTADSDWSAIEYAFICVPTPESEETNSLDLSSVIESYDMCLQNDITPIIRSTLGPDQVAQFPQAVMMPEFLREAHWKEDTNRSHSVILGGNVTPDIRMLFSKKQIVETDAVGAMMYKLSRNALLAVKVVLANQLSEMCDNVDADYNNLVQMLNRDNTLGHTHWDVPGPDGSYGYGGKCFPKDIAHSSSLCTDTAHNIFSYTRKLNSKMRNSK